MDNNQPTLLICIYTCDDHARFHDEFQGSQIGKYLSSFDNARQVFVFADPTLSKPHLDNNCLTINTNEAYSNLCLKTYKMIQYCSNKLSFDFLIKMDVTSGIKSMNTNPKITNRVADERVMINHLEILKKSLGKEINVDYTGWKQINANQAGVERWAELKGLDIDYKKLLGDSKVQSYFSGKCYTISQNLAEFIGEQGEDLAHEHTRYLPGSEDMMVGRLYEHFKTIVI